MEWKIKNDYMICPVCNSMFFKVIPIPKNCPRCLSELKIDIDYNEVIELTPISYEVNKRL